MYEDIVSKMTLEEKIGFLTGENGMETKAVERLSIPKKWMADGPHGVRVEMEKDSVSFPNLCCVGSTWDTELAREMGEALANECIERDIDMLLAPGINIKRNILCGRNFEYMAEDPVVAGEMGAAYINGLEKNGISASLKHFACNSQEHDRLKISGNIDERTLREIYLKGYEIAVKKSQPTSVMCAYNKVNSVWCSENKHLLTDILRDEWGYKGFVVSDWGAVHNIGRAIAAGLDLDMPEEKDIRKQAKECLEKGSFTEADIDRAVERVLHFALREKAAKRPYDRQKQHDIARRIAADGAVLLKNEGSVLPLTAEKYKKIAVVGEFAVRPNTNGQGSAEVNNRPEHVTAPFTELKKALPDAEVDYFELYKTSEFSSNMMWPLREKYVEFLEDKDIAVIFIGSMVSEDTECYDRRDARFNPNYNKAIEMAKEVGKKVVVVMQNGSAMILDDWRDSVEGIMETWLAGEAAGEAAADVLTGKVNPSGKLAETFPNCYRKDLDYPGCRYMEYGEGVFVGYRYYDVHPGEITFPFGFGLSYTDFAYSDMKAECCGKQVKVSVKVTNTGDADGAEVVQIYVGGGKNTVRRPEKELKAFKKLHIKAHESAVAEFVLDEKDFAFYNVTVKDWITEKGCYTVSIASSSRDIKYIEKVFLEGNAPYTLGE